MVVCSFALAIEDIGLMEYLLPYLRDSRNGDEGVDAKVYLKPTSIGIDNYDSRTVYVQISAPCIYDAHYAVLSAYSCWARQNVEVRVVRITLTCNNRLVAVYHWDNGCRYNIASGIDMTELYRKDGAGTCEP